MKLSKRCLIVFMAWSVLITLFCSATFSEDRYTWQAIVDEIEALELGFHQDDSNNLGTVKSEDLHRRVLDRETDRASLWFVRAQGLYDGLVIRHFDEKPDENSLYQSGQFNVPIESDYGSIIRTARYLDRGHSTIYAASWVYGNFQIELTSSNFRGTTEEQCLEALFQIIPKIESALDNLQGSGFEDSEPAVNEPSENLPDHQDVNVVLLSEINPKTRQPYEGIVAGEGQTLQFELSLGDAFSGRYSVAAPEHGTLVGIDTGVELKQSGKHRFVYRTPKYMTEAYKGEAGVISDYIRVEVKQPSGKEEVLSSPIKLYMPTVVLVHGFTGDETTWLALDKVLSNKHFNTLRRRYHYWDESGQSIPVQADVLGRHIEQVQETHALDNIKPYKVDIVAHSMGGLISRYLLSRLGDKYPNSVRKLIMVGTPNHGCGPIDKWIGKLSSYFEDVHQRAAAQLYESSPFILDLNKDEMEGTHLHPQTQYGLLYGSESLFGDGVVTVTSAFLNGVTSIEFPGRSHSPAVSNFGPPLTTDEEVQAQILKWLGEDISPGDFINVKMYVYSYEGQAYRENYDADKSSAWFVPAEEVEDQSVSFYESVRTEKGRMTLFIKSGRNLFGKIDLDENTELYINYASPNLVKATVDKGSARFTTRDATGQHFEVTLGEKESIQSVRGRQTAFVVSVGEESLAYSIDGMLDVVAGQSYAYLQTALLKSGQAVRIDSQSRLQQASPPLEMWWEDGFYGERPINNLLTRIPLYAYGVAGVLILLLLISLLKRKG